MLDNYRWIGYDLVVFRRERRKNSYLSEFLRDQGFEDGKQTSYYFSTFHCFTIFENCGWNTNFVMDQDWYTIVAGLENPYFSFLYR